MRMGHCTSPKRFLSTYSRQQRLSLFCSYRNLNFFGSSGLVGLGASKAIRMCTYEDNVHQNADSVHHFLRARASIASYSAY